MLDDIFVFFVIGGILSYFNLDDDLINFAQLKFPKYKIGRFHYWMFFLILGVIGGLLS